MEILTDQYNLLLLLVLCVTGVVAGGINTVAGGGSNLTVPVLLVLGLPADVANATNRVGVVFQSLTGVRGYDKHGALDRAALGPILIPTLAGGVIGGFIAAFTPPLYLKPLLLGSIFLMSLIIVVKPNILAPPENSITLSPKENKGAWWGLFLAGLYGGFAQAGVGFIFLAALAGGLRYDLVRANALKMACTLGLTLFALAIFIAMGQVRWLPGLVLAFGSMIGAHFTVKLAVQAKPQTIKWFLFVMTAITCSVGFFFSQESV